MRLTSTRWALLAPVAAIAMVAAACGGGSDDSGSGGNSNERASAIENDINATSRDQLQQGGTLSWPLTEIPPNFNLNQLDGSLKDNADIMESMMPRAFVHDAGGTPHVDKNYFDSVEKTSDDPLTISYKINPKVTWYSGAAFTWEDIKFEWQANNGSNPAYSVNSTTGYDRIKSVEMGENEREAIVTYSEPFADWTALFGAVYPKATNQDPKAFNTGWTKQPLDSAGPFRFDSIDQTAKTITLTRNEKWWGDKALLDKVIYRAIDSDAQIDALANSELDFINVGPDVNKLQRAQSTQGVTIHRAGGPNFRHITINGTSPVLQDVKVRQALAKAINRDVIAEAMLGPLGVPPEALRNHLYMPNQAPYKANDDVVAFNVEEAKSMLDDAGWTLQGDVRKKDGKDLVIRFVIPSNVATSAQESELIQGMLSDIGVKVNIQTVPSDDFFEKYITPGDFEFTVFSWIGTPYPASSSTSIYRNPKKDDKGELDIQQNYARVGSQEIDDLQDEILGTTDANEVQDLVNQLDGMIWDEVHSITLYARPDIVATKSNLANFGALGFADITYQDMGFKK